MQVPEEKIPEVVSVAVVRKIEADRNGTLAEVAKMPIESIADLSTINEALKKLTLRIQLINEKCKKSVDKAKASYAAARELRDYLLRPVVDAKTELSGRLMQFRREAAEEIAEKKRIADAKAAERAKVEEEYEKKEQKPPGPEPKIEQPLTLREQGDTTKTRKKWDVNIIDKAKVPEAYKIVNEILLRKDMHAAEKDEEGRPIFEVPGVEVVCEEVPIFA